MTQIVQTGGAPRAIGPYSQAIKIGQLVFCSGQIGLVPETGKLTDGGIAAETERVIRNLDAVLTAAGTGLQGVVKTTVFLADMREFEAMNEIYGRMFGDHRPARSTIQAAALPRGARVEIDVIAEVVG
ncbi:MAG: RidA family protein [Planctomycetota bacterium]